MTQDDVPAEDAFVAEHAQPPAPVQPGPWGFWATMGLSLVVMVALVAIGFVVELAALVAQGIAGSHAPDGHGLVLSLAICVSAVVCLRLVVAMVKSQHQFSVRDYLALKKVSTKCLLGWTAILLTFLAAVKGTTWLLEQDIQSDSMIHAYRTAIFAPLLWVAMVIAGPVFEEIFFRGFMFRGIQQSRPGTSGAVLITSLIWSLLHLQYNLYGVVVIFLIGLLLGVARARSNSTYLTIAMHALWNAIAIIELEVYLRCC